jgi:hypothetical protein
VNVGEVQARAALKEARKGEMALAADVMRLKRRVGFAVRALERFAGEPSGVPGWSAYLDECERNR